jgi:gas vesicle protein
MELSPKVPYFVSYFRTQSKSQQIQENINNPLHRIRSQCNKIRPQQQNNLPKILKHMENEQHTAKKKTNV